MAVVGLVSMSNQVFWNSDNSSYDASGFLFLGGLAFDLAGIPFFISSANNSRKAATISFNYQKGCFLKHNSYVAKAQPAIMLRIPL